MRREMTWLWAVLALGAPGAAARRRRPPRRAPPLSGKAAGPRYVVVPLGSLGRHLQLQGNSINDLGWVGGLSALAGDGSVHATLWRGTDPDSTSGRSEDPNSAVLWPSKNDHRARRRGRGDAIGPAARGDLELPLLLPLPHREDVPRGGLGERAHPRSSHLGRGERLRHLGQQPPSDRRLGGEPRCSTPRCTGRQKRQFHRGALGSRQGRAARAAAPARRLDQRRDGNQRPGPGDRNLRRLRHRRGWGQRPAGGDVGEDGAITDLGTLGGEGWNTPMALNAWGDVVGFANAPGTPVDRLPAPALSLDRAATGSRRCRCCPATTTVRRWASTSGDRWSASPARAAAAGECCGRTARSSTSPSHVLTGLVGTIVNAGDIDDLGRIGGQFFDSSDRRDDRLPGDSRRRLPPGDARGRPRGRTR